MLFKIPTPQGVRIIGRIGGDALIKTVKRSKHFHRKTRSWGIQLAAVPQLEVMGIKRIVPTFTVRTVVRFESEKDERKKVERWTKIAEEAAKQSGRGIIPVIDMPVTLPQAIMDAAGLDLVIIPYELETGLPVKEVLRKAKARSIGFFIGPEGGFEPSEVERAKDIGAVPVSLGRRILRTETAGIAVLTSIMYEYDQMR